MQDITLHDGDCLEVMKSIPDGIVDLVIADPPCYKAIGEKWEYLWRTEKDYLDWTLKWLSEASRTLRCGGTLYCFGYFRMLALIVPHLKRLGLELRQQIVVNRGLRSISGRATRNYRMFPNTAESILFAIKDNKRFIKPFFKERQKELGLSAKQINDALGVKSNGGGMWSLYTGRNICEQFPKKEMWDRLTEILKFDLPYGKVAQTFNPQVGFGDVWDDIDFYDEERYHPTQKPQKLLRRLIEASTNEGDTVFDPFCGCGSVPIASMELGRKCIAVEIDRKYLRLAKWRISEITNKLF